MIYEEHSTDNEPVEFRVVLLKSYKNRIESNVGYDILSKFLETYNSFLDTTTPKDIERLFIPVGKNPEKYVFLPKLKPDAVHGREIFLGRIGYIFTKRYPTLFDKTEITIEPLTLPETKSIMYLAHFVVFEHDDDSYLIFEMNSNAPSISKLTEYLCNAANVINFTGLRRLCPIKYHYVTTDPRTTISQFRYVTGISISGDLRASHLVSTFIKTNIFNALLETGSRRFFIELTGKGEPIRLTISEVIDFLEDYYEKLGGGSISKLVVRVKRIRTEREYLINLLENRLAFKRFVSRERDDAGHELGSLKTEEAYNTLKELVKEVASILDKGEEKRTIKPVKTLDEYLSS